GTAVFCGVTPLERRGAGPRTAANPGPLPPWLEHELHSALEGPCEVRSGRAALSLVRLLRLPTASVAPDADRVARVRGADLRRGAQGRRDLVDADPLAERLHARHVAPAPGGQLRLGS